MAEAGTDYLVIGTGTAGLAFADTLIAEEPPASRASPSARACASCRRRLAGTGPCA